MHDCFESMYQQQTIVEAQDALAGLSSGSDDSNPEDFDCLMAQSGLTPEDIGATAEAVAAAKERWHKVRKWREAQEV